MNCKKCGKSFDPYKGIQLYCSIECRTLHYLEMARLKNAARPEVIARKERRRIKQEEKANRPTIQQKRLLIAFPDQQPFDIGAIINNVCRVSKWLNRKAPLMQEYYYDIRAFDILISWFIDGEISVKIGKRHKICRGRSQQIVQSYVFKMRQRARLRKFIRTPNKIDPTEFDNRKNEILYIMNNREELSDEL